MRVSIIWNTSELSQSHLRRSTAIFVVDCFQFGPSWMFGLKMELIASADLVRSRMEKLSFFWPYMEVSTILITSELSALHLSPATAIFVVDCCQCGPNYLKMELMVCADLVGNTTGQICLFTHPIWLYQWYETFPNCLHHTSAVTQPFLLLIAANLALAGLLGWKLSFRHVPTCLAVQQSKYVFFLILYNSINDMKHFWTVCISPQPCHSHFCCWWLPIWPSWMFGL